MIDKEELEEIAGIIEESEESVIEQLKEQGANYAWLVTKTTRGNCYKIHLTYANVLCREHSFTEPITDSEYLTLKHGN